MMCRPRYGLGRTKGTPKKIQLKKTLTSFASPAGAIAKIARRTHRDTSTSCLIGSRKMVEMGDGELSRVWLEFDYEKKEEKGGVLKAWPARGRAFGVQLEKER